MLPTLGAIFAYARVLHPNWRVAEVIPPADALRLLWVGPADLNRFGTSTANLLAELMQSLPAYHLADIAYENLKIAGIVEQKFARLSNATRWLWASLASWAVIVLFAILSQPAGGI